MTTARHIEHLRRALVALWPDRPVVYFTEAGGQEFGPGPVLTDDEQQQLTRVAQAIADGPAPAPTPHLGIEARAIAEQLGVGTAPQPSVDRVVERLARLVEAARREGGEQALAPVHALFAGDPDTPCRTTWRRDSLADMPGTSVECVEVPLDELRDTLDEAERAIEGRA